MVLTLVLEDALKQPYDTKDSLTKYVDGLQKALK